MDEYVEYKVDPRPAARGIYIPRELAGYYRAATPIDRWAPSSARLFYWIRRGLVAAPYQSAPAEDVVATFDDLVTSQAITLLREAGIPLPKIRDAELYFADLYKVSQPFTHRSFWTSGPDIFGRLGDLLISGTRGGQIAMEFMRSWLHPVETRFGFNDDTGRPEIWEPRHYVELSPSVQFGQPCIAGTRIPTSSIRMYVVGGDPPDFVANFFGITEAEVEAAVNWERARAGDSSAKRPALSR